MTLPTPPTKKESVAYLDQNKAIFYVVGTLSLTFLSSGMALFSLRHPTFLAFLPFVLFTSFYLSLSYAIGFFGDSFDIATHNKLIDSFFRKKRFPSVDILLPCCGEDLEVLENTYKYVKKMQWKGKLRVFVLDDKGDTRVKRLARKYSFTYWSRPDKGVLKKAGNLRYAFARTESPFFVIFDADFAPSPFFLYNTIPYFEDKTIAIVQTPQYFDVVGSWIQKGAAFVQELFYRMIQTNRNTWNAAICVGTCAVYRRRALEPFGGTAAIDYSEDVHTGVSVLESGWKLQYIPLNLSKGLCPAEIDQYFSQQYRWCMGSVTLFLNREFWRSRNIGWKVKINYLSGMLYYWITALGIFFNPLPALLMVWFFPSYVFWYNSLLIVPSFVFGTMFMIWWSRSRWGLYSIGARVVAYYAHVFAIRDKIMGSLMPWVPTGTRAKNERYSRFKTLFIYWNFFTFTLTVAGSFHNMNGVLDYNYFPTLFFTFFNMMICLRVMRDL
jgi:cellulose synthase/poly-beta-1,6-N-acetylglucosamine synthase-like glycosyltransferase